jgi:hypothetical protein
MRQELIWRKCRFETLTIMARGLDTSRVQEIHGWAENPALPAAQTPVDDSQLK